MKPPTKTEIIKAREKTKIDQMRTPEESRTQMELMECWKGGGWRKLDLYIGIVIGLQIAEDRATKRQ